MAGATKGTWEKQRLNPELAAARRGAADAFRRRVKLMLAGFDRPPSQHSIIRPGTVAPLTARVAALRSQLHAGTFVPTVPLDTSMVRDLRKRATVKVAVRATVN